MIKPLRRFNKSNKLMGGLRVMAKEKCVSIWNAFFFILCKQQGSGVPHPQALLVR